MAVQHPQWTISWHRHGRTPRWTIEHDAFSHIVIVIPSGPHACFSGLISLPKSSQHSASVDTLFDTGRAFLRRYSAPVRFQLRLYAAHHVDESSHADRRCHRVRATRTRYVQTYR